MFILYAIPLGIVGGYLLGGRLERLSRLRFHWAAVAFIGLAVQVAVFTEPLAAAVGDAAPPIYVASTVAVLAAVLRNLAIPGLALVALGATSNLLAIVANGGYMPADPAALASVGILDPAFSNSSVVDDPALRPLTDIFALPAWVPLANVFSIGDVLLGIGVALTIALGMRGEPVGKASRGSAPGRAGGG